MTLAITRSIPWPSETPPRSEEHTSELQSQSNLVCRLLLEKKKECLIMVRSIRALNVRFNSSSTKHNRILLSSNHLTLNATVTGSGPYSKHCSHTASTSSTC